MNAQYFAAFISTAFNSRYFGKVLKHKLSNDATPKPLKVNKIVCLISLVEQLQKEKC